MNVSSLSLRRTVQKHELIFVVCAGAIAIAILAIGIGREKKQVQQSPAPLEVDVVKVKQENVPLFSEWIGTTDGMVNADIRAQVSGYLIRKDYTEGAFVKQGQLLFEENERLKGSPVVRMAKLPIVITSS